ncbi:MAG TPA: thioredoxin domain-containing protein [Propionibacteriaceae bacterium]|nr:thioredoxin domain-containing protein [Propionibacteriaceae bacterium]
MSNPRPSTATSRRELLRQQQLEAAKRQRRTRLVVVITAIVAIVLIGGAVWWGVAAQSGSKQTASGAQITPPDAMGTTGIAVHAVGGTPPAASAPSVYEYQDYQCPACEQYFKVFGPVLNQLVSQGKIKLEYRTMTFLDTNLRNDSSTRSAVAAACADTVGAYEKYHDVVYKNQPTQEGAGYTDQQLRDTFAQQAGITGADLTKFQKCYDTRATLNFVKAVDTNAGQAGITSTPTFKAADASGKVVTLDLSSTQPTADAVMATITKALAG